MLVDRRYCYPLTITDFASRYLTACEALHTTMEAYAFAVFESTFKGSACPYAICTDNGVLFASPNCRCICTGLCDDALSWLASQRTVDETSGWWLLKPLMGCL